MKLARPRTWCFIVTMFVFGYAASGSLDPFVLALGIIVFCVMTAVSNLFNAWTGQAEDRINLPHRAVWLQRIGQPLVVGTIAACYVTLATLPWLAGPGFALVVLIGALISVLYSWGLTLKSHPVFSLISFSTGVLVPFIAGWSLHQDLWTLPPVIWVITYFFLAYGTMKNLPDVEGDRAAGVRTIFTIFEPTVAVRVAGALMLSPYAVLGAFVAAGWLDLRYLIMLAFAPGALLVVSRTAHARSKEEREATHALGYFYQLFFFLAILLVFHASPVTAAVAAVVALFAVLMDAFKIDSRPYDLRLSALLRLP